MEDEDFNKEILIELFYSTKGNIDKVNEAIDARFKMHPTRRITMFEKYVQSRLQLNPKVLKMSGLEVSAMEVVYLSQHPNLQQLEVLDLRKNGFGDAGMDAIAQSTVFTNLKKLDLRNNRITRVGMTSLAQSKTLSSLEALDLRVNSLGKRWEEKLREVGDFPKLTELKIV
jgi:Ran GTPase-activating protein (RanGAP) involved in mRNA processing and transport